MEDIIDQFIQENGNNEKGFYASLSLHVAKNSDITSLLDSFVEVEKKLRVIKKAPVSDTPLFKKKRREGSIKSTFTKLLLTHRRILDCPTNDEHVVLLAALKGLEDMGEQVGYKEVVKEVLVRNLHKSIVKAPHFFIGREKEIADISRVLTRNVRNNALIVGPSGIGKTTLSQAIISQSGLSHIYQIYPGSQSFFDQIASYLTKSEGKKPLIFLDELFSFTPEQIKYAVENAQVIATANEHSYRKFASEQPGIISKFEVISLEEPAGKALATILSSYQAQFNGVTWDEEIDNEIMTLGKQYMSESLFPAKGLMLLEEVFLLARTQGKTHVTKDMLRVVVSQKTNIPISSLTEFDKKDLSALPDRLGLRVKGQGEAVEKVARVIQRSKLGFGKKNKPIGSFLFVGPSGVGKTELAKTVAHEIFGDSENMVRLDMSEFAESHNVQRLIGAPPGYIGFEEGGQLTNPIKAKPYNLVLLDEIEKANPRVFDIFLQVLDDGRLTDGQGSVVDFRNTIIIATSNAGIEDILDLIEEGKTHEEIVKEVKDILSDYFRVEFINRFDDVIVFQSLSSEALSEIAKLQVEKLKSELAKRDIGFSMRPETLAMIAKESYDPRYGARGLLRYLQDNVENKLAEMIINNELTSGQNIEF